MFIKVADKSKMVLILIEYIDKGYSVTVDKLEDGSFIIRANQL